MKKEYEENLMKLKNILSIQGMKVFPAEEDSLSEYERILHPYLVPNELIILYQYIGGNIIEGDDYIIGFSL